MTEDEASDHSGCNAGYEHRACGYIQATFDPGLAFRIQTMKECLDGAVEELCGQNQADAKDDEAPFPKSALEDGGCSYGQNSEEEVNEEAGMTADATFNTAPGFAKLVPPTSGYWSRDGLTDCDFFPPPYAGHHDTPAAEGRLDLYDNRSTAILSLPQSEMFPIHVLSLQLAA